MIEPSDAPARAFATPAAPALTATARHRHPLVARDRDGNALTTDLAALLIAGEHLAPAARRILRVLLSAPGELFSFTDLATLAAIGDPTNTPTERAARLHRHLHYIRRGLISDCWIANTPGVGFVLRRRAR
jgi:DNA-binding response OmpR family regulator